MNRVDFVAMMDRHYAEITEINRTKGHDYAGDDDALANFKEQAAELGLTPEQVWGVFAGKHVKAVHTFIREGDVKSEPIEGRIHDVILYHFLLLGLIEEKKSGGSEPDDQKLKLLLDPDSDDRPLGRGF